MTKEEKIKKINQWQDCKYVHPLTCGNNASHKLLYPVETDDDIILLCYDCDYQQNFIPETIFKIDLTNYDPLKNTLS